MTKKQVSQLSPLTASRGVDVGVAIILESSDELILITKRSQKMRTFPNVWVPPGGHIEVGESLHSAGLRELHEETGISVQSAHEARILGLWESAFPPMSMHEQLPSRHHIVIYLSIKDKRTAEEINKFIKLDEDEVSVSAWVCCHLASKIVALDKQFTFSDNNLLLKTCDVKYCFQNSSNQLNFSTLGAVFKDNKTLPNLISVQPLFNLYSHENHIERVSTGTKFAMKLWLEKTI